VAPVPLIVDVDTGVDDALALLYACASEDADLVAATCVMGNVTVDLSVSNTLAVLEVAGRPDVEVARGAERPLVRDHEVFPYVHGEGGLGRAELTTPSRAPSSRPAHRLIVDVARERPGDVVLIAVGPLTNVALALAEEPELPTLLRGFVLMGGAFEQRGNVTPAAEANIWVDPEAAQAVFRGFAGAPEDRLPVCVGLDVTERVQLTATQLEEVCGCAPGTPLSRFLDDAVRFYIDFYSALGRFDGAAMHDPLAVAVALDPTLATLQTTRVEVETDGQWTRGETIADLDAIRNSPWPVGWEAEDNARVAVDVDADAFLSRFDERLRSMLLAETAG
jgi:purine nucleosidase